MTEKITEFSELQAWQEGHKLVLMVYAAIKTFPKEEACSLTGQLCLTSSSVTANIAEGFARQVYKEKIQFFSLAQDALTELKNQFFIAKDIQGFAPKQFQELMDQAALTQKNLQELITKTRSFSRNEDMRFRT